jgi:ribonuclease R
MRDPALPAGQQPTDLRARAREIARDAGFDPDFPADAEGELAAIAARMTHVGGVTTPTVATASDPSAGTLDLRALLWSSIDNRESRDLDQIEYCEQLENGDVHVRIGIADVDSLVVKSSALDRHAAANTTSVYTGVATFPMLPERLSTDLTSLNEGAERLAVVVDLVVTASGDVRDATAYRALVVNRARLTYEVVGNWLGGMAAAPPEVAALGGLAAQIQLQDRVAQALRARRQDRGALDLETIEAHPVITGDGSVVNLEVTRKSRARELIEDFMIAANVAMAEFLERRQVPSIRRVVHVPKRWPRIVDLAREHGTTLPPAPNAAALAEFLRARRAADPDRFADLSLAVVKLLGPGEYAVERPWASGTEGDEGHFGLAVDDYSHTTAPNRRYADLVMQRLLKATLLGAPVPYAADELDPIAARCTAMENAARKVEREMRKVVAATLLAHRIGESFDAIVTGVSTSGTYARLIHPPAEGRVVRGEHGVDVGDRIRVTLVSTDPRRGFVDFERSDGHSNPRPGRNVL